MKKTFVLVILFVFPIVVYLFFASGVTNFGKLPVLTESISDVSYMNDTISLKNKITILGFLGKDIEQKKGNAFNLNQKIYKRFSEFTDFQFVMVVPKGVENEVAELKSELGTLADAHKWNFVYGDDRQIERFFDALKTDVTLNTNLATPYVFIIDKDLSLRGRKLDDGEGNKFGFNAASVGELNNQMVDDVKIILAEYRMALKKNNAAREK